MKQLLSRNHSNRKAHNWLIYEANDAFLLRFQPLIKGIMYDLGCGEKPYEKYFKNLVERYIGVDWSDSLHTLKADVVADLNQPINIPSNVADTVISISVMEHLHNPANFLSEAYRILQKDGNIILQTPFQWQVHEAPHDYFRYTNFGLQIMLEKAGFKDIKVYPINGFFSNTVLKWNYFSCRLIRGPKVLRWFITIFLYIFWYLGQIIAPLLDKILDKNWTLETSGYWVTATK